MTAVADPVDFEAIAAKKKPLCRNAAFARQFIPQTCFPISRRSTPGWQCFYGSFSSPCPNKILQRHFLHLHSISHRPGRQASRRLVSSDFVWLILVNNVTSRAKSCLHCQQSKIHCHICLLPQPIPIPQRRFAHLHIDLVGPLQYSSGCDHISTIIDCTSKWTEAVPFSETSATACARALVFSWITRFGVPKTITSDLGPQFTSNI